MAGKWMRTVATLLAAVGVIAATYVGFQGMRTWESGQNQENVGVGLIAFVMFATAIGGFAGATRAGQVAISPPERWRGAAGALLSASLLQVPCWLVGWLCLSWRGWGHW